MWHFVNGVGKVQLNHVNLALALEFAGYCLYGSDKLRFTLAFGTEAMLGICKDALLV